MNLWYTRTRTAQQTGLPVTVGTAHALDLDDDEGHCKWYTICDTHGTCIGHTTLALAREWSTVPLEWCEFCATPDTWCATCCNDSRYCTHPV